MTKLIPILLSFSFIIVALCGQSMAQGKEPKGRAVYFKYENENVEIFRDRVDFQLPEPNVVIKKAEEGGGLNPDSLSGYFTQGKTLHIQADQRLQEWVSRDSAIKSKKTDVQGFRIQVYAGNNRRSAFSIKGSLISRFPEYAAYLEYKAPNYVVRVGDFMKREDAILFQKIIRETFPGAFIVPDVVKVPKYNPNWKKAFEEKNNPLNVSEESQEEDRN